MRVALVAALALVACGNKKDSGDDIENPRALDEFGKAEQCKAEKKELVKLMKAVAAENKASPRHPQERDQNNYRRGDLAVITGEPADPSKSVMWFIGNESIDVLTQTAVDRLTWDHIGDPIADSVQFPTKKDEKLVIAFAKDAQIRLASHVLAGVSRAGYTDVSLAFAVKGVAGGPTHELYKIANESLGEIAAYCKPVHKALDARAPLEELADRFADCECGRDFSKLRPLAELWSDKLITLVPVRFTADGAALPTPPGDPGNNVWRDFGPQIAELARKGPLKLDVPPPPPPPGTKKKK